MHIALVNESTLLHTSDAQAIALAVNFQLKSHFCPAWELTTSTLMYYADRRHAPAGSKVMALKDVIDVPEDLGYHTENGGVISSLVGVKPVLDAGGVALLGPTLDVPTVCSVVSHEACELVADPSCNRWVDGPNAEEISLEVCDPVESDSYAVFVDAVHATLSNFVLPAWFDPQSLPGTQLDWLRRVGAAFGMTAGGYVVYRTSPGQEKQRFGAHYPGWRDSAKDHAASRRSRRSF